MPTSDSIKITMTRQPSVKIRKVDWPAVASSSAWWQDTFNNPDAHTNWRLIVPQHSDGRGNVAGLYK